MLRVSLSRDARGCKWLSTRVIELSRQSDTELHRVRTKFRKNRQQMASLRAKRGAT